jgi:hypothetical protein
MAAAGLSVESPWDLVNARQPYAGAIPVLLEWLDRAEIAVPAGDRSLFREGLVRSLAVKEARGVAASALLREVRGAEASPGYRWAVGNSLEIAADDSVFDELADLALERRYGRDRQMVVLALARMKNPRAVEVLTELLDDESVVGHAVMARSRRRSLDRRSNVAWSIRSRSYARRRRRRSRSSVLDPRQLQTQICRCPPWARTWP